MTSDESTARETARAEADDQHAHQAGDSQPAPRAGALWPGFFPYDTPYPQQHEGIETAIDVGRRGGYTLLEGACGTGKTLLALTSALSLVRDPSTQYTDVFVLTSVKQQLRAFEDDLTAINQSLRATSGSALPGTSDQMAPVTATTLVGKPDVCPYVASGAIDRDDIYHECSRLRSTTRSIINDPATEDRVGRAIDICDTGTEPEAGQGTDASSGTAETDHTIDVDTAAYGPDIPTYGGTDVCPYYAQTMADDMLEEQSIATEGEVLSPQRLTEKAVQHGACPHSAMQQSVSGADVVIGNYYHAFEPQTIQVLTHRLLDDSTFVICDEAHMLIERVRDQLSHAVGLAEFRYALEDLDAVLQGFAGGGEQSRAVYDAFGDTVYSAEDVEALRTVIDGLRAALLERVDLYLAEEYDGTPPDPSDGVVEHIPLGSVEGTESDDVTDWLHANDIDAWLLESAREIAEVANEALMAFPDPPISGTHSAVVDVGQLVTSWYYRDHHENYRGLELSTYRRSVGGDPERPWREDYGIAVRLDNCIPSSRIHDRLSDFGGGILMSATLSPIGMFEGESGLRYMNNDERPVEQTTFGLSFPAENRRSLVVPATKYTSSNRGPPPAADAATDESKMTPTRQTYAEVIEDVVTTTPGNVLVAMPSYREANWAAHYLQQRPTVGKEVLIDESSNDGATDQLKAEFFDGGQKVLATSMLGTLTEGVDYTGDRLRGAVICGLPLKPSHEPPMAAREAAYEREFGAGHPFAFAIPAVRKARQALGRVLRGPDEVGTRVLVDTRYAQTANGGVQQFFPDHVVEEFDVTPAGEVRSELETFWQHHDC